MSFEWFVGFTDGDSRHTCNMASVAWVIYAPSGQLVSSCGASFGLATSNMDEYSEAIELLWDATLHGITRFEVRLES